MEINNLEKSEKEVMCDKALLCLNLNAPAEVADDVKRHVNGYVNELKQKIKEWEEINNNLMGKNLILKSLLPLSDIKTSSPGSKLIVTNILILNKEDFDEAKLESEIEKKTALIMADVKQCFRNKEDYYSGTQNISDGILYSYSVD